MSTGFRYFNSCMGADVNVIDVMIADDAHRTRETRSYLINTLNALSS
jgi:hypothetical protein